MEWKCCHSFVRLFAFFVFSSLFLFSAYTEKKKKEKVLSASYFLFNLKFMIFVLFRCYWGYGLLHTYELRRRRRQRWHDDGPFVESILLDTAFNWIDWIYARTGAEGRTAGVTKKIYT